MVETGGRRRTSRRRARGRRRRRRRRRLREGAKPPRTIFRDGVGGTSAVHGPARRGRGPRRRSGCVSPRGASVAARATPRETRRFTRAEERGEERTRRHRRARRGGRRGVTTRDQGVRGWRFRLLQERVEPTRVAKRVRDSSRSALSPRGFRVWRIPRRRRRMARGVRGGGGGDETRRRTREDVVSRGGDWEARGRR